MAKVLLSNQASKVWPQISNLALPEVLVGQIVLLQKQQWARLCCKHQKRLWLLLIRELLAPKVVHLRSLQRKSISLRLTCRWRMSWMLGHLLYQWWWCLRALNSLRLDLLSLSNSNRCLLCSSKWWDSHLLSKWTFHLSSKERRVPPWPFNSNSQVPSLKFRKSQVWFLQACNLPLSILTSQFLP